MNDTVNKYNHVGKYDTLWVWERKDGLRWSVHLKKWVTEASGEFTSFVEDADRDEYAHWVETTGGKLPEGGEFIDINEF